MRLAGGRCTAIHGANQDRIRDPDPICPGQVSVLPSEDVDDAVQDEKRGSGESTHDHVHQDSHLCPGRRGRRHARHRRPSIDEHAGELIAALTERECR